jgi:hypothetical protein
MTNDLFVSQKPNNEFLIQLCFPPKKKSFLSTSFDKIFVFFQVEFLKVTSIIVYVLEHGNVETKINKNINPLF